MKGQIRKRFLAFILAVIIFMEPGCGVFPGLTDVWGSGQDFPEFLAGSEVSGNSLGYPESQGETGSQNGETASVFDGEGEDQMWSGDMSFWNGISDDSVSGDEISENSISGDDVPGDILSIDSVSENTVSKNTISKDTLSEDEAFPEVVSSNDLSRDELQNNSISENKALENTTAKKIVTYKVTFDSQNGSAVKPQVVQKGAKAKKPVNPVRSKYIFSGWYKGSKKYDFSAPVKKNLKLAAKWTKVTVGKSQIKKLTNPSRGVLRVQVEKVAGAKGYEIQVSTDQTFAAKKESYLASGTAVNICDRQKNKTYYVRVRAYKQDSKGANVYGKFNGRKSLKITKGIIKVEPSADAGIIKSVALTSKKTVQVKAKVSNYVKSADNYYYLFHLSCSAKSVEKDSKPDAKIEKTASITMKTSLDYNTSSNKLQSRFVLAVKTEKPGTYTAICTPQFISNPEKLAPYSQAFPKSSTKKGLQVNPAYLDDAVALGVKHTAYNICLDDLIATAAQENDGDGISFSYNDTVYWFNRRVVESIDHTLGQFKQNHMVVSAILLMRWREDLSYLIPATAREEGHGYYALNTSEERARNHWEAVFTFLAQRYTPNGLIANWILGNEVNNYGTYHYTGSNVLATNAKIYSDAYRMVYIAVRSVYAKARIYISLDQVWTYLAAGSHMGKQFLETFASYWSTYGDMGNFHIALHPYPAPLEDPAFWTNSRGLVTNSINSPCISMGNLHIFTDYIKKKWGNNTRIILSEQGFTSKRYGVDVPQLQAAAIAYAYYLAEFNDSVDAFILHRHVDHQAEEDQGLYLGLWSNNGDRANPAVIGSKKYAWDIFKDMDTPRGNSVTKFALTYIGASSWKAVVPGYDKGRFS